MNQIILNAVISEGAWIVGSQARPGAKECDDVDILVPSHKWWPAITLFRRHGKGFRMNAQGGWRCVVDGVKVDIWPMTLDEYCQRKQVKGGYLWCPKTGTRIHVGDQDEYL